MSLSYFRVRFKQVKGYPGYFVSNDGRVWTTRYKKRKRTGIGFEWCNGGVWIPMKLKPARKYGYLRAVLRGGPNTVQKALPVHRLVLEHFFGPCPLGMECCHEDGDASNNHISNLRWDTRSANNQDKKRHGTFMIGERHGMAIFTEKAVRDIRAEYATGLKTYTQIGRERGVSLSTIRSIVIRRNWKHVAP